MQDLRGQGPKHPDDISLLLLALKLARGLSNQSNIIGHAFGMNPLILLFFILHRLSVTLRRQFPSKIKETSLTQMITTYICGKKLHHNHEIWSLNNNTTSSNLGLLKLTYVDHLRYDNIIQLTHL